MGHTEVVNLVRAAPAVVDLTVGRVLEAPKGPVEAHLLPDICFSGDTETLGRGPLDLTLKTCVMGLSLTNVFNLQKSWCKINTKAKILKDFLWMCFGYLFAL